MKLEEEEEMEGGRRREESVRVSLHFLCSQGGVEKRDHPG